MRDKVLLIGDSFSHTASSNSNRKPAFFDWTNDPAQATVDTIVCIQGGIINGVDLPGRKIGWLNESPAITEWQNIGGLILSELDRYMEAYECILTSDRAASRIHPKFIYHAPGSNLPWIPEDRYAIYPKSRLCSMFASDKNMVEGHSFRKQVAEKFKDRLDLFGGALGSRRIGGQGSHPDKSEGLLPYRFNVATENCKVPFYYTEKLTDCFATGTVPVYWGADCIDEICNPEGVIRLDENFDIGILDESLYQKMLPAVRENLELVRQLESADDLLYRIYIQTAGVKSPIHKTIAATEDSTPEIGLGKSGVAVADSEPTVTAGDLPFRPWTLDPIITSPEHAGGSIEEWLKTVTLEPKENIETLESVPAEWLSTRRVESTLKRPRSIGRDVRRFRWLPQLETAFLLQLPGGFVGDNVVFDEKRYYRFGRWWLGGGWDLYKDVHHVEHVNAAISIAAWGGEAFQHFIMDAIPTLASTIDLLESPGFDHVKIATHNHNSPMAQWFWRRLGLSDRIVQKPLNSKDGFVIHADEVLYSNFMPSPGEFGIYPRGLLRPIQRRLGLLDSVSRDRIIYLKRPHHSPRNVVNESDLLDRVRHELSGSGLKLEVFEGPEQDVGDELERFRRAAIIFGPHGGALANIVFAQPGAHVIEFLPIYRHYEEGQDSRAMYWGLAQAAGLEYWTVEPVNFDFEGREGMVVDIEEVAAIVRQALLEIDN